MKKFSLHDIAHFTTQHSRSAWAFLMVSLFAALFLLSPWLNVILDFRPAISDFSEHIVSNAAIYDLDISARVGNFYTIFIGFVLLTAVGYVLICNFIGAAVKNHYQYDTTVGLLRDASFMGIVAVFGGLLNVVVVFATFFILLYCLLLLVQLRSNKSWLDQTVSIWILIGCFPLVNMLCVIWVKCKYFGLFPEGIVFRDVTFPIGIDTIFFALTYTIVLVAFWYAMRRFFHQREENVVHAKNALFLSSVAWLCVTGVTSILLETCNIINLRFGIVLAGGLLLYIVVAAVGLTITVVLYRRIIRSPRYAVLPYNIVERYHYPLMLVTLALLIAQPWRMFSTYNEFFEVANQGISVDHFFRYGSIPIVETYDAHMFSHELFAFVYGFLNGYEPWAPLLYDDYILVAGHFVLYYVFRRIMGATQAFLLVATLPLLSLIDDTFALSGLPALAIIALLQKPSEKRIYLFWVSILFLCFYKLDIGFASTIAGLGTLVISKYVVGSRFALKRLLLPGIYCITTLLLVFVVMCLAKNINPVSRFHEFLVVSMSNQNWAIDRMGDAKLLVFRITYYILPSLTLLMIIVTAFGLLNKEFVARIKASNTLRHTLILFVFFSVFFVANIPRGIVRHTLEWGNIKQITSTIPMMVLMFAMLWSKKRQFPVFLSVFFGLYILLNLNAATIEKKDRGMITRAMTSRQFFEKFEPAQDFEGTRVRDAADLSDGEALKKILDEILAPHETYFDFSSYNYLHAVVGRKNPTYVNQSPLMINGDTGQRLALSQIKNAHVSAVLMPILTNQWSSIDQIYVDFKYYLLAEYIYKNYTPIWRTGSFDLYVLKNRKQQYLYKLHAKNLITGDQTVTDFSAIERPGMTLSAVSLTKLNDGRYDIIANGSNPLFSGLLNALRETGHLKLSVGAPLTQMIFTIDAKSTGNLKFYFQKNHADAFSEDQMKQISIDQTGVQQIVLPIASLPAEIMVGINIKGLELHGIKCVVPKTSKIEPSFADHILGHIPRIWAEKSDETVFSKVEKLATPTSLQRITMLKSRIRNSQKPFYLYIEAASEQPQMAHVAINDFSGNANAVYHFNLLKGEHRYALRLSSSYFWWQQENSAVLFNADAPTRISACTLIAADGSEQLSYNPKELMLSNLNDANWTAGVGLTSNMLLLDHSPEREKLIKGAKRIKLKDDTLIPLAGHQIVGGYIQLLPAQSITPYRNLLAYPNTIELIP